MRLTEEILPGFCQGLGCPVSLPALRSSSQVLTVASAQAAGLDARSWLHLQQLDP